MEHARAEIVALGRMWALACLGMAACGGGGGDEPPQAGLVFSFGAVTRVSVPGSEVSLEVRGDALRSLRLLEPELLDGTLDGPVFRLWSVPVVPGENRLRLEAERIGGERFTVELLVLASAQPEPAVRVDFQPTVCEPGQLVRASIGVREGLQPVLVLLDEDRDGVLERVLSPDEPLELVFHEPGLQRPRIAIRDATGAVHAAEELFSPAIRCLPPLPPAPDWTPPQALPELSDLQPDPVGGTLFALSASARTLFLLEADGSVRAAHPIHECVEPVALAVEPNGDVYVVDRAGARVVRLLGATQYGLDAAFGAGGSAGGPEAGEYALSSPASIVVVREPWTGEARIVVSDSGNDRLVVLGPTGVALGEVRGDERGGLRLRGPGSLEALGDDVLVVVESDGGLRALGLDGGSLEVAGGVEWSLAPQPSTASFVKRDPHGSFLLVGDEASGRLGIFDPLGSSVRGLELGLPLRAAAFLVDEARTRLVLAVPEGLVGYEWQEDPPGAGPEDAVAQALARVLAGELDDSTLDTGLAEQLRAELDDPRSGPGLTKLLQSVAELRCTSRSGDFASLTGIASGGGTPVLVATAMRDPRSGAWKLVRL